MPQLLRKKTAVLMADPTYAQMSVALGLANDRAYALEYRGADNQSPKLVSALSKARALRKQLQSRARELASI